MTRTLAIGDIHGCFKSLRTLSEFVGFQDSDTIITLGDYVDRGPNSCAVMDWLICQQERGNLIALRGNHEIMMIDAREDQEDFQRWIESGGDTTLRSYSPFEGDNGAFSDIPDSHWNFLENALVPTFETDRHFFVHANAYSDLPIDDQPDFILYWEEFTNPALHESGKIMVCGHTSQKSGIPLTNGNAVCIDTRACRGGWLTCLDVDSGMIWQSNEAGETRRLLFDDLAITGSDASVD